MPAVSSVSRAENDGQSVTAPPVSSTFSRLASFVMYFFRHSNPSSDTTTEALSPPARPLHPPTSLTSEARRFLRREVRPLIEQGRLLDLAEALRACKRLPDRLNENVSADERNVARVRSIIAERLLTSMPEWLSVHYDHLSDRALAFAKSLESSLKADAAGGPLAGRTSRPSALASLIDAYLIDQFPSGVPLVFKASRLRIPSVVATRHHTRGGHAVPAIAEFLKQRGVSNGTVSNRYLYIPCPYDPSADIFWGNSKESIEFWSDTFRRLRDKGLRQDGSLIIVVDDNLSDDVRGAISQAFKDTILKAYAENDPHVTQRYRLALCGSPEIARRVLNSSKVAGLVSDLFSPLVQTEKGRKQHREYFTEICKSIGVPPNSQLKSLLDGLDAEKLQAYQQITKTYDKLYSKLREPRGRSYRSSPTKESPSEESPQS